MPVAEIKKELHKAIDGIDNKELLQSILTILTQDNCDKEAYRLAEHLKQLLKVREEEYLKGDCKTETFEEFRLKMNKKYSL